MILSPLPNRLVHARMRSSNARYDHMHPSASQASRSEWINFVRNRNHVSAASFGHPNSRHGNPFRLRPFGSLEIRKPATVHTVKSTRKGQLFIVSNGWTHVQRCVRRNLPIVGGRLLIFCVRIVAGKVIPRRPVVIPLDALPAIEWGTDMLHVLPTLLLEDLVTGNHKSLRFQISNRLRNPIKKSCWGGNHITANPLHITLRAAWT